MNPSKLDKRITFQRHVSYQDEEDNWIESYEDAFTVWGAILGVNSMRNSEITIAGAVSVQSPKKITIRVNKNLKHNMRATYRGRFFEVLDFDYSKNSKAYYEIICNEVGING